LGCRRIIYFIDHCGVMNSCVKGSSVDKIWRSLLVFEKLELEVQTIPWFTRVPSPSNISDGPSRGRWHEIANLFKFVRDKPRCPFSGEILKDCSLQGD